MQSTYLGHSKPFVDIRLHIVSDWPLSFQTSNSQFVQRSKGGKVANKEIDLKTVMGHYIRIPLDVTPVLELNISIYFLCRVNFSVYRKFYTKKINAVSLLLAVHRSKIALNMLIKENVMLHTSTLDWHIKSS